MRIKIRIIEAALTAMFKLGMRCKTADEVKNFKNNNKLLISKRCLKNSRLEYINFQINSLILDALT